MEVHVEHLTKGTWKVGHKLSSTVGCGVVWDTMLGVDVHDEQECELFRVDGVDTGDENALFGEAVNNNKNCSKTAREGQFFNEVY